MHLRVYLIHHVDLEIALDKLKLRCCHSVESAIVIVPKAFSESLNQHERERRNLQRACALLDCLRIAAMYDDEELIDAGDVAYVVRGLVGKTVNALDRV